MTITGSSDGASIRGSFPSACSLARAGRSARRDSGRNGKTGEMLDHLSIQCSDPAASAAFYDAVLAPLGGRRILEFGDVIGFGTEFPSFWIGPHQTGDGFRESHIAFRAPSQDAV